MWILRGKPLLAARPVFIEFKEHVADFRDHSFELGRFVRPGYLVIGASSDCIKMNEFSNLFAC